MKKSLLYLIMAIFLLSFVVGCSDSDDDDDDSTTSTAKGLTGVVIADAALSGAKVCVDKDKDKVCDADEASATTDASGKYTIEGDVTELSKYPILVEVPAGTAKVASRVTTDATTASYILMAPAGKPGVVSPISTLIQASFEKGDGTTIEDCEKNIAIKTGLTTAVLYNNFLSLTDKVSQKMGCISTLMAETFANEIVSLDKKATDGDEEDSTKTYTKNNLLLYNLMFAKLINEELQAAVNTIDTFYTDNGNSYANFKTKSVKAVTCSSVTKYNILNILSLYDYSTKTSTETDTLKKILDSGTTNGEVYLSVHYDSSAENNKDRLMSVALQFEKDTTKTNKGSVALWFKDYNQFAATKTNELTTGNWDTADGDYGRYRYLLKVAGDNGSIWSDSTYYSDSFAGDYVYDTNTDTVTVTRTKGDLTSYTLKLKKLSDLTGALISSYFDKTKIPFISEIYPYVNLTSQEKKDLEIATATDPNITSKATFLSASSVAYQPSLVEVSDRYYIETGNIDEESGKNATIDTFIAKKDGDCDPFTPAEADSNTKVVKLMNDKVTDTYGTGKSAYPLYASFAQSAGGSSNIINFWEYSSTLGKYTKSVTQGSWAKETVRGVQMLLCTIPSVISSKYDSFAKDYQVIFVEYVNAKEQTYSSIRIGKYIQAGLKYDKSSQFIGSYVFNQDAFKTINNNIAKFEKLAWGTPQDSSDATECITASLEGWQTSKTGVGIINGTGGDGSGHYYTGDGSGILDASYAYIYRTGANTLDTNSGLSGVYLDNSDNNNLLRAKDYECSIQSGTVASITAGGTLSYSVSGVKYELTNYTTSASNFLACEAVLIDNDANTFKDSIGFVLVPKTRDSNTNQASGHAKLDNLTGTALFGDIIFRVTDKKALNEYLDGTIASFVIGGVN